MSSPARKIAARLSPRTALCRSGRSWRGLLYSVTGDRLLECEHRHRNHVTAKRCAQKLLEHWARLEAARGVSS